LPSIQPSFLKNSFRRKIALWSVMRVHCVQGNAGSRGASRPCQRLAKYIVTFVGNANPNHGAQDNGIPGTEQDDSPRSQP
jgi:hypothetical protein